MTEFIVMLSLLTSVGLLIGYVFLGGEQGGGSRTMPNNAMQSVQNDKD